MTNKIKLYKYKIILYDDDINSFQRVISVLMNLLEMDYSEAEACASATHLTGRTLLKITHKELAETYVLKLRQFGLSADMEE